MTKYIPLLLLALILTGPLQAQKKLTNELIWYSSAFSSEYVPGLNSMDDGEHYTVVEDDNGIQVIAKYEYRTGKKVGNIISANALKPAGSDASIEIGSYSFSADGSKMLFAVDEEQIYRYSTMAHFYVYDKTGKRFRPLSDPKKNKQRLATISPDGKKAAFVRDNNLFIVDLGTMDELQITQDGNWNTVLNGATDWVYEEEFALVQGYAWSPQSTKLMYLRSDETSVPEFNMDMYQGQLYPSEYKFKYPKAGEVNSLVELHVYDLTTTATTKLPTGHEDMSEVYLPRFGWTNDDNVVWFMQMNRLQNQKSIYTVGVQALRPVQKGLKAERIYDETSKTYIEVTDDLHFLKDGKGFVLTNETDGYNHIYLYGMDGKMQRQLTSGEWDVKEVTNVDEDRKRVIYVSAELSPMNQEIYSVSMTNAKRTLLSPAGGTNDADWSTGSKYFVNTRSTANEPSTVTLHDGSGKQLKVLKDNAPLRKEIREYALQPKEFFDLTTEHGTKLNGWMIKPKGFQSRERYPVFLTVYGGPGHNTVTDDWGGRNLMWHQMLAQEGYIVVSVDPRGTGFRGHDFKHITYGQLGKHETQDMISAAKWLATQPWVDGERIGIQGWSYGGYLSSLCITKGADQFKAAIAVAPVTNWRFYDTIYTERYMGLPQDNASGYDDNSPINHVEKLKGPYLLVHGTADDNVHFQNTTEMISALVAANKQFRQFAYPDKNHGIYGGTTRMHLFQMMTDFLKENL